MAYQNIKGAPREKTMLLAYLMVTEFGVKQVDAAKSLRCSQSTIAQWIKEVKFQMQINDLKSELSGVRAKARLLSQETKLISQ
ncbi:hypothetical protein LOC54_11440 [Acetobacter sp. AN02]|uniref:hypothetical protein n=1 Tax=Acetobacter sp. AN02 TaxID=2894186 RepID=UPI00243415D3|nr:hypothetical protein [Acetobacter sp. AN02]MDG6095688.1 hypothetical protein [Acetobacter sp. AN02]